MTIWREQTPTKPGNYWYYGWMSEPGDREPKLYYINVKWLNGHLDYRCYFSFLYPGKDGAYGLWSPVDTPALPEITQPPTVDTSCPQPFARRDDFYSFGWGLRLR